MKLIKDIALKSPIIIAYLLVVLFTYAAVSKLLDFETFTVQLAQSPLLSAYAGVVAWCVPGIELGLSVLLLTKRFRVPALYASFTLLVMFTAYIIIILNFSDFIPCSCGGVLEQLSWTQHLTFNSVFIFLAGVAILRTARRSLQQTLLLVAILAILGTGTVTLLFVFSEKKIHRNNAFQRRYPHHPIVAKDTLNLGFNSYYFAGGDNSIFYLGNITAPREVVKITEDLKDTVHYRISMPRNDILYRNPRLRIMDSTFLLYDGTIPIIHTGKISDWKVTKTFNPQAFFTFAEAVDPKQLLIRTISSETGNNLLGTISLDSVTTVRLFPNVLEGNIDGYFDRDGQILFNKPAKKFLYVYYYNNKFIVGDKNLNSLHTKQTIDTIETPQIFFNEMGSSNERVLNQKSIRVNGLASSYGNYLLIKSDRLGKYEPNDIAAGIIDVYNIKKGTYEFSFYLYYNQNEQLLSYMLYEKNLYALIDDRLYRFEFKNKFLN